MKIYYGDSLTDDQLDEEIAKRLGVSVDELPQLPTDDEIEALRQDPAMQERLDRLGEKMAEAARQSVYEETLVTNQQKLFNRISALRILKEFR